MPASYPNLVDVASRTDPNGAAANIAEILQSTNEVMEDVYFVEGNLPTGHKSTTRVGLPTPTWRKLNYGVLPDKSKTVQVTDTCGMLEAYSEVDKSLASLYDNKKAFLLSESKAHVQSMNKGFCDVLIYGDTAIEQDKFMGLQPRFLASTDENGGQIIKADSSASGSVQTSIWLVVWGDQTVHGIYPKGSQAGLQFQDLGEQTLIDANGGRYQGYRCHFKWDCGLVVRDWRYIVRIANVQVASLTKNAATGTDLIDCMTQALETVPGLNLGKASFLANRTVTGYLRRQMVNKSNVNLTMDQVAGKHVLAFDGVPIRRCDSLINTEALVA